MKKSARGAPILAIAFLSGITVAHAQSCREQVDRLVQQYGLNADDTHAGSSGAPAAPAAPPATTESQGLATTDKLARSGGVVTPPDIGTPMAMQPPKSGDSMPTAPPVEPAPSAQAGAKDSGGLTAADRARMESLLLAARDAERQGKDEECLERLRQAEAVPGVTGSARQ